MEILEELMNRWIKNTENHFQIIAFGSSNSELHWHSLGAFNWFSWLTSASREWIGRHVTTINQGTCGETADDLLKRIKRDVISYSPDIVIVTIGGNDANAGIPVEKYKENMNLIVEKIQQSGAVPVLQTYYCPLYEEMSEPFQRFPEFVDVNRAISSEKAIPLIDQYTYFSAFYENDLENYSKIMLDGLHVNEIGNAIMGVIACRLFYLPDPIFVFKSFEEKVLNYLEKMNQYQPLPKKVRVDQHEQMKKDVRLYFHKYFEENDK
jgi:lysophospholipase L1-like esterase